VSSRRDFLQGSITAAIGAGIGYFIGKRSAKTPSPSESTPTPITPYKGGVVLSTWNHGIPANAEAWKIISNGGSALDAVEKGVMIVESDPTGTSVGIGGTPDRDGHVTLDACIMDDKGNAGSVCFLEDILHPISVARKVMEETPHVLLAGEGARTFALDNGFDPVDLLTESGKQAWQEWLETSEYKPIINIENHDTIGLVGMDQQGNLAGACTTSGLGYKMRGRVGDSPIIGAGLFVDNEVGAATATGLGEAVLKTCGSFLIVELMRQGATPQEACEEGVMRIVKSQDYKDFQIGYIALGKSGEIGAYAIQPGFQYALHKEGKNEIYDVKSFV
jgi:N4-(beta-N-acetylglucosaminyl)-L-asparaginase